MSTLPRVVGAAEPDLPRLAVLLPGEMAHALEEATCRRCCITMRFIEMLLTQWDASDHGDGLPRGSPPVELDARCTRGGGWHEVSPCSTSSWSLTL